MTGPRGHGERRDEGKSVHRFNTGVSGDLPAGLLPASVNDDEDPNEAPLILPDTGHKPSRYLSGLRGTHLRCPRRDYRAKRLG